MLDLIKKKYYAEVAKMYIKTESSVHEITKKGKKGRASFAIPQTMNITATV